MQANQSKNRPAKDVAALVHTGAPILKAIASVAQARGLSEAAVSAAYYRSRGETSSAPRGHGNQHLTDRQNKVLLYLALAFSGAHLAWDSHVLSQVVFVLFTITVGTRWCERWIEKHLSFLSPRKGKYLARKRDDDYILSEV